MQEQSVIRETGTMLQGFGNVAGLGLPQWVPHRYWFPQCGQHLIPVCDAHAAGLWADDHMTHILPPAVVGVLSDCHSQGEVLPE